MNSGHFLYAEKVQSTEIQWLSVIPDFMIFHPAMLDGISNISVYRQILVGHVTIDQCSSALRYHGARNHQALEAHVCALGRLFSFFVQHLLN